MKIEGPLDLVIVEGWMLGFHPVSSDKIESNAMKKVNELLGQYKVWEDKYDSAIIIGADPEYVYEWREQAEKARRDAGEGAMTKEEVKTFCDRFMPSYQIYGSKLIEDGVAGVDESRTLKFMLNIDR